MILCLWSYPYACTTTWLHNGHNMGSKIETKSYNIHWHDIQKLTLHAESSGNALSPTHPLYCTWDWTHYIPNGCTLEQRPWEYLALQHLLPHWELDEHDDQSPSEPPPALPLLPTHLFPVKLYTHHSMEFTLAGYHWTTGRCNNRGHIESCWSIATSHPMNSMPYHLHLFQIFHDYYHL